MTDVPASSILDGLVLFHGELNPQQAYVYARLPSGALQPRIEGGEPCKLRGTITGPTNRLTRTLTATVPLRQMTPGANGPKTGRPTTDAREPEDQQSELIARAIVPDPCFWSPGYPYLYDVQIELLAGEEVVATERRSFGMRMLGVHKDHLLLESQPWKILGAKTVSCEEHDAATWRGANLVQRIACPSDDVCNLASQEGVMLIADLPSDVAQDNEHVVRELTRLSRHAAVAVVALPATAVLPRPIRSTVPNLLLGQCVSADHETAPPAWADLLLYEVANILPLSEQLVACQLPVLIQTVSSAKMSTSAIAEHCQELAAQLDSVSCVAGILL